MRAKSCTVHQAEMVPEALVTKHLQRAPKRVTKQAQVPYQESIFPSRINRWLDGVTTSAEVEYSTADCI